jgi:hypothetical protein
MAIAKPLLFRAYTKGGQKKVKRDCLARAARVWMGAKKTHLFCNLAMTRETPRTVGAERRAPAGVSFEAASGQNLTWISPVTVRGSPQPWKNTLGKVLL